MQTQSSSEDCDMLCLFTRGRLTEALQHWRESLGSIGRPQVEQDLVGFGLKEALGLKRETQSDRPLALVQPEEVRIAHYETLMEFWCFRVLVVHRL